jgi:hypothetical protein
MCGERHEIRQTHARLHQHIARTTVRNAMLEACREGPSCSEPAKTRGARSHGAAGDLGVSARLQQAVKWVTAVQPHSRVLRFIRIRRVVQPKS